MSEQEQSVSQEQPTSAEPTTLDQVYKQFNVEESASNFNPQPQPQAQPAASQQQPMGNEIPDPVLDQQGFRSWLAKSQHEQTRALSELTQTQRQLAVGEIRRREEADIKSAAALVREKSGVDMDDDTIEIALGVKARKDPRFKQLWDNRDKSPAAWRAAVTAVSHEIKSKYQFKTDPQLTENVRAAKQSTQSSLTSKDANDSTNPIEKRLANTKSQADFDSEWRRLQSEM